MNNYLNDLLRTAPDACAREGRLAPEKRIFCKCARLGLDKLRELGLDKGNRRLASGNRAWQGVYPNSGYRPCRSTKGTVREGGSRVPAIAWMPGHIKTGPRIAIIGGFDLMATFARSPASSCRNDREGKPIIFDSYDMAPVLFGTGPDPRKSWLYFTELELTPALFASAT